MELDYKISRFLGAFRTGHMPQCEGDTSGSLPTKSVSCSIFQLRQAPSQMSEAATHTGSQKEKEEKCLKYGRICEHVDFQFRLLFFRRGGGKIVHHIRGKMKPQMTSSICNAKKSFLQNGSFLFKHIFFAFLRLARSP